MEQFFYLPQKEWPERLEKSGPPGGDQHRPFSKNHLSHRSRLKTKGKSVAFFSISHAFAEREGVACSNPEKSN